MLGENLWKKTLPLSGVEDEASHVLSGTFHEHVFQTRSETWCSGINQPRLWVTYVAMRITHCLT